MRRWLVLLLTAAVVLPASACGRDYSADMTGALGVDSFTMTEEDVALLEICMEYDTSEEELAALAVTEEELRGLADSLGMESSENGGGTLLTFRNGHSYQMAKDGGEIEAVRYALPEGLSERTQALWESWVDESVQEWTEAYGQPNENKKEQRCTWYGSVDGERASLTAERGDGPSALALERVK